jgi:3-oxoacyl-(acyl-carrier-protein) synthase
MPGKRVVVTGMSVNTPLGDTLSGFYDALLAGKSAVSRWKCFAGEPVYSKIGADLSDYDVANRVATLEGILPAEAFRRLRRLIRRVPWSTQLTLLVAADAWLDADLPSAASDADRLAVIVAGHNIGSGYSHRMGRQFLDQPDLIDGMYCLYKLDSDHAGCVSELLQSHGPIYTAGAACASGNLALRSAVDEIRHHGQEAAIVIGPVMHFSPVDVHAMALMGAIPADAFDDEPEKASRPFDVRREGFVPAHGAAALVLEDRDAAQRRGARVYAEVLAVAAGADGNHLPQPCRDGQVRVMRRALQESGLRPEQIDYVSAHATSTPAGDICEVRAIKEVFGPHAHRLKVNAAKSMLGHTCWAAALIELIAAILQMRAGVLHPSINIEELDAEVDLDVCRGTKVAHPIEHLLKNSFGFGGIDCVSVVRRHGD